MKNKTMEPGTIKTVEKKGLKFDLMALDEEFLQEDEGRYRIRQVGIVVTDLPSNEYGIKKGSKMLIA